MCLVLGGNYPNLRQAAIGGIAGGAMIYNTAIGMFYALGRRLSARRPSRYRPIFLGLLRP